MGIKKYIEENYDQEQHALEKNNCIRSVCSRQVF